MHLTWTGGVDAGYIALADVGADEAVHQRVVASPGKGASEVTLDLDASSHLLGVELLGSRQLTANLAAP